MADHSVIEAIQLSKIFYDFWGRPKVKALDELSFTVKQGEVFGLLGPNGSGKTTTIKLLLGLLFPSAGNVKILGMSPRNIKVKQKIGFLPEESYLYPYQTAEEALFFYGKLFDLPPQICKKRVDDLLDMVGLQRVRKRPLREYSKGMARRIGIAQALINDPEIVILDEPTSGLDPIGTREVKDFILNLKKYGKTILLCSHLLADVEDVCDNVMILYSGKKVCFGKVQELLGDENRTRIVSEKISPQVLDELKTWMKQKGIDVLSVSSSFSSLEECFLREIEKARQQTPTTQGASAGKSIEGLFSSQQQAPSIISQLVKKEESISVAEKTPVENPENTVVQTLVKKAVVEESPESAPTPVTEEKQNIIGMLTKKQVKDE